MHKHTTHQVGIINVIMKNETGFGRQKLTEVCCCFKKDGQRWPLGLGDSLRESIMKKGRKPHICLWEQA